MTTRKIIIDTDPGVDDAMAIFLALRSPELDVIGLTTVFGNQHTALSTTNALRLLEIAGRADIPVAHGAEKPLVREYRGPVPFIHGEDGQGNIHLPPPSSAAISQPAAAFIVDRVMNAPGQVTLVPIGPLTNIALALHLEPRIAEHVQEVVLMGGNALVPGNATPAAEANIHNDPEAAEIVFGANWKVTMVGLDVTHETVISREQIAVLDKAQNPLAQHISRISKLYQQFVESSSNMHGYYIHDPSTIAYLIDPTLFQTHQWPVRVETQGISAGKTWPATNEHRIHPNFNVCTGVKPDRTLNLILKRLGYNE
jgi:purine nucleosidase